MPRKPSPSESPKASAQGKSVRKTVGKDANAAQPLQEAQGQPEKRPVGRPTLYKAEMCETALECGAVGMSRMEIARELDVSKGTLYAWMEEHEEFLNAMTRARELEQAWWEQQARLGLVAQPGGPTINAALWAKNMAARFREDYTDRTENEGTVNINVRHFESKK